MSNNTSGQSSGGPNIPSNLGMPIAIVLAGGLIALAIYFGSVKQPANSNGDTAANLPAQTDPAQPTIGDIRPISNTDHVRGSDNAPITIIEYSDTECPYCKVFHSTMRQIFAAYPNDIRWVYRYSPIPQLHSKASAEANAVECAAEQGKFWEFLDLIYDTTPSNDGLDLAILPELAKKVGVADIAQFEACVKDQKYAQRVADDQADAQVAGGMGTPYSLMITADGSKQAINGAQPFEKVKAAIDAALSK